MMCASCKISRKSLAMENMGFFNEVYESVGYSHGDGDGDGTMDGLVVDFSGWLESLFDGG